MPVPVAFSLSRVDTESAVAALETLATDPSRSEELRKNAVVYISRTDVGNQVEALGRIYRSASTSADARPWRLRGVPMAVTTRLEVMKPVLVGPVSSRRSPLPRNGRARAAP